MLELCAVDLCTLSRGIIRRRKASFEKETRISIISENIRVTRNVQPRNEKFCWEEAVSCGQSRFILQALLEGLGQMDKITENELSF